MSLRQFCKEQRPILRIFPGEYKYQLVRKIGARQYETLRGVGLLVHSIEDQHAEIDPKQCTLHPEGSDPVTIRIQEIRLHGSTLDILCIEI